MINQEHSYIEVGSFTIYIYNLQLNNTNTSIW